MGFLQSLTTLYRKEIERHHNLPFLKAAMAACALVAIADGKVTLGQRARIDQILETLDALKVFDPHEGVELFNDFIDAILESPEDGRDAALKAIFAVARDKATAKLLIRLCCAVSEAKAETHLADQIEIVMLCSRLGIEPKDCGLSLEKVLDDLSAGDR
jgi:tellurite resistance protein